MPEPRRTRPAPKPPRDRLLTVVLFWTTLVSAILFWLPMVRCLVEGAEYSWGLAPGIGGRGTAGPFLLLPLGAAFSLVMLYYGRRGARLPFHGMLLAFHVPLAIAVVRAVVARPEEFRFEGASLGIDVPLAVIGPALFGSFALLAVAWVVRDLIRRERRTLAPWRWTPANRMRLVVILLIVPAQIVLLRGSLGSAPEVAGVLLTVAQWFLVNRALNARMLAAHLQWEAAGGVAAPR